MIISPLATKKPTCKIIQKIAQTRQEREAAFSLIYKSYLRAGLCEPNQLGLRISPYQLSPSSEMFITVRDGEVVATVSLIIDSDMGLPMESVYPEQVSQPRQNGYLMGEISCLADRRKDHRRIIKNLCELTGLLVQYARFHGLDGVMLVTRPKHAKFYKRYMCYESIGPIRPNGVVRDTLGEPLRFDFAKISSASEELYQRMLGEQIPDENLARCPVSLVDRKYFAAKLREIEQPKTNEPNVLMSASSRPPFDNQIQTP